MAGDGGDDAPVAQVGQSGQPRPEAVRRTTAPLGTITHSMASATSVSRAKRGGGAQASQEPHRGHRSPAGPAGGGVRLPRCRGPTTPPPAAAPRRTPDAASRIGLFAGLAIILVAIGVAVAFALPEGTDSDRVSSPRSSRLQELGPTEAPPATLPDAGAEGVTFSHLAAAAGWMAVGSREDRVEGRDAATAIWERAGRRVAQTVAGGAAPRPAGRRPPHGPPRASCSTASTWTGGPR